MKTIAGSALVLCAVLCLSAAAAAQTPVGALAINERQGDQYGWAVDYETPSSARTRALSECGSGCSVVLTFAPRRPGDVFRDCAECPEMVVLAGGGLAMGRYEVTVGEYRAFASATDGVGAGGGCSAISGGDSWRDPGFPQTDRHPVTCVSWDDAQEYVSWLSRRTGATYRLPTEAEWERAAAGTPAGVGCGDRASSEGTCPVGSYGANAAGLLDMAGNLWEWTLDCLGRNCGRRLCRGGSWIFNAENLRPGTRTWITSADRSAFGGFRVSRTLD